jgi:hypothetical protein
MILLIFNKMSVKKGKNCYPNYNCVKQETFFLKLKNGQKLPLIAS